MSITRTPALVVGGGITGLSTALFLAWHGVPCVLVERHPDLLSHPRARGLTPRTMECYRQVGLEPAITAAAFAGTDFAWTPVRAQTLADDHEPADEPMEDDGSAASPSPSGPIDQDELERLVRERARELGADLRFDTELTAFSQDDTGVTATLTDRATGAESSVAAEHLVAADGVASPIRDRLGIGSVGPGPLYQTITALVDADLDPALRGRRPTIAYLQRPRPFTILMAHDDAGRHWVFGTGYDPSRETLSDYTDARVVAMVRDAAGVPDAEVRLRPQVPGTDRTVLGFPIVAQVAATYRRGRVLLVGDAAHAVPPTGGLGANTGIQDAHNLAWKLAAVTTGAAGPDLLDTYDAERRPTALMTMEQALARFGSRMDSEESAPLIAHAAVSLGYRYRSAATPGASGDPRPLNPNELSGQPGTRAPHVPIRRAGDRLSTLDLYGRGFVLLTGRDGDPWLGARDTLPVRVEAYRFGVELDPVDGADPLTAHGIAADGAVLVRPDGFVAWRNPRRAAEPAAELGRALESVLAPTHAVGARP